MIDQRALVAGLAAHGGGRAQRPGAIEQRVGLAHLLDEIAQDLGVGGGAGGDDAQRLVDHLDLVAIQQVDRYHFGRLQHRTQPTTVPGGGARSGPLANRVAVGCR